MDQDPERFEADDLDQEMQRINFAIGLRELIVEQGFSEVLLRNGNTGETKHLVMSGKPAAFVILVLR